MNQHLFGYLSWIVSMQLLLMASFWFFSDETMAIWSVYDFSGAYFAFLVFGLMVALWAAWVLFLRLFALRAVGDKSTRAAKARGYEE